MVTRYIATVLLLCSTTVPIAAAQQRPEVTVAVRPDRVRVGETFVVTVRTVAAAWPDQVDMEPGDLASVIDYEDRSSAGVGSGSGASLVFERDFQVQAEGQGIARIWAAVIFGPDTIAQAAGPVSIYPAGLDWPMDPRVAAREGRRTERSAVLPQGVPPSAVGRDADRQRAPQGLYPPGSTYPTTPGSGVAPYRPPDPYGYPDALLQPDPWSRMPGSPSMPGYGSPYGTPYGSQYGPSGWGVAPYGSGWAPSAAGDRWWPELVPRLERYQTAVDDPNGLVRLEAGIVPERVYAGQQATFVATATFPPEALARLGGSPEFFPPSASNAWSVDLPYAPPTPATARGRAQEAHTFMRAFFPLSPGRFVVEPARLLYSVGSGVPGRPLLDTLTTEALAVDVLPIPERDAPLGWTGAVGRYRVEAWLQPEAVAWGEVALLTVAVSGAGHVRSLARPDPGQVWGAELRPTGERAIPEVRDGVVGGVKTFSWLVVPMEPGPLRIGPVIFSFFDPWTGAFGQVATEELILHSGELGAGGSAGQLPYRGGGLAPATQLPGRGVGRMHQPETQVTSAPVEPVASMGGKVISPPDVVDQKPPSTRSSLPVHGLEETIQELEAQVGAHPGDAEAWHRLVMAHAQARPGEGWAEWASLSGLRNAPRHAGLRTAAEITVGGMRSVPGLARIPLRRSESLLLGGMLSLTAIVLLGLGARGAWTTGTHPRTLRRKVWVAVPLIAASALAFEPIGVLRNDSGAAVLVGGSVQLRASPTFTGTPTVGVTGGTPLWMEERFGSWVRVRTAAGDLGWVEEARVAPLPAVPLF